MDQSLLTFSNSARRFALIVALAVPTAVLASPQSSPAASAPRQGETVRVIAAEGDSFVKVPGGVAKRLIGKRSIPTGSIVDVTRGSVKVQYECRRCAAGERIHSGKFSDARFKVGQDDRRSRATLTMRGSLDRCANISAADGTRTLARHLEARVGGAKFQVIGRYASVRMERARVLVADYCARTFVAAARGTVRVEDLQRNHSTTVRPQSAIDILASAVGEPVGAGCCASSEPWGAVSSNTQITLGDGTTPPVQTLYWKKDRVLTTGGRTAKILWAAGSDYVEDGYAIYIETESGRQLTVPANASVISPEGEVRASEVGQGDQLLTETGIDTVASVTVGEYRGQYFAIWLEGDSPFFANGILVGGLTG